MNKMLFALFTAASIFAVSGCAADADDAAAADEAEAPEVTVDDDLAANRMTIPVYKYVPRVRRADILAGGGSCAGSLCTIGGNNWQCSGPGYCTYLGSASGT